jgi:hypothetical protein
MRLFIRASDASDGFSSRIKRNQIWNLDLDSGALFELVTLHLNFQDIQVIYLLIFITTYTTPSRLGDVELKHMLSMSAKDGQLHYSDAFTSKEIARY